MAAKVSKNAREGAPRKPRVPTCACGERMTRVKVVPGFKGRARMEWRHETGLTPVCAV
jgi:hypothetical protein